MLFFLELLLGQAFLQRSHCFDLVVGRVGVFPRHEDLVGPVFLVAVVAAPGLSLCNILHSLVAELADKRLAAIDSHFQIEGSQLRRLLHPLRG